MKVKFILLHEMVSSTALALYTNLVDSYIFLIWKTVISSDPMATLL
jgi:hypothetical protein